MDNPVHKAISIVMDKMAGEIVATRLALTDVMQALAFVIKALPADSGAQKKAREALLRAAHRIEGKEVSHDD